MEENKTSGNFTDTFLNKLKEQSFTIILLVMILYGQNQIYRGHMDEYKKMIDDKEQLILKLTDEERQRFIERTKYLQEQRDAYIEKLLMNK